MPPPQPQPPEAPRPDLADRRLQSGLSLRSKKSFRSYTTSSFADDERSSTDGGMNSDDEAPQRPETGPQYNGHDARPTSKKEILGWYMYAFAAETYVICGIGTLVI